MENQKFINLYNLAMSDELFFEELMTNPISTLELNQKRLELNSEELVLIKNIFSAEHTITNVEISIFLFKYFKGKLPPIPIPPPIIIFLKRLAELTN